MSSMALWTFHLNEGPQKVNHAAICIDGIIFSFGGFCTGEDFSIAKDIDVYMFDLDKLLWSPFKCNGQFGHMPYQRYGHTVVEYKGDCYLYGGRNDINGVSEHLYKLDLRTRVWTRPRVTGQIPNARDGHTSCVIGHCMYLFAGFEERISLFTKTVYRLNLKTLQWTYILPKGPEPDWRDFHTATPWRHKMIVFGGRCDEQGPIHTNAEIYSNDVYIFDTLTNTWSKPSTTGDLPVGRRSHNAFEYNNKIHIFGGFNGEKDQHYNDIYSFSPETMVWSRVNALGDPPRIRRRACCCISHNKIIIFGGTSPVETTEQLAFGFRHIAHTIRTTLLDLQDLHILEILPSLKTLSALVAVKHGLDCKDLPHDAYSVVNSLSNSALANIVKNG